MENLIYSCIQLLHNFGAVIVVSVPVIVLLYFFSDQDKSIVSVVGLIYFVLAGWCLQIFSGISFAVTSYLLLGHIPQLDGVAEVALYVKLFSASASLILLVFLIYMSVKKNPDLKRNSAIKASGKYQGVNRYIVAWGMLSLLSIGALSGAAFLRWYA